MSRGDQGRRYGCVAVSVSSRGAIGPAAAECCEREESLDRIRSGACTGRRLDGSGGIEVSCRPVLRTRSTECVSEAAVSGHEE